VEQIPGGYRVSDAHGRPVAYVYGADGAARSALPGALTPAEALALADRIVKRLGATFGRAFDGSPLPPKRPRMRWATYQCLEERYEALQRQGMAGAYAKFLR
jgi:hypothetical protein